MALHEKVCSLAQKNAWRHARTMVNVAPSATMMTTLDGPAVHALSNHLAVILGFIELVLAQTRPDDPRRKDLLEIRTAAKEAARIIGRPIDEDNDATQP
jgi:hypothetical protein